MRRNETHIWKGYVNIYSLSDLPGNVFYVGCTAGTLAERLKAHLLEAKNNNYSNFQKNALINHLDYNVKINLLETKWAVSPSRSLAVYTASDVEVKWINHFINMGIPLVNKKITQHTCKVFKRFEPAGNSTRKPTGKSLSKEEISELKRWIKDEQENLKSIAALSLEITRTTLDKILLTKSCGQGTYYKLKDKVFNNSLMGEQK